MTPINSTNLVKKEFTIADLFKVVKNYKWSILIITILTTLLAYIYAYYKPSIYQSYSILKVKSHQKSKTDDIVNSAVSTDNAKNVKEEITLLKTYKINQMALKHVDFSIQYFHKKDYKTIELLQDGAPIKVELVKVLDPQILGKRITLTPTKQGYKLSYKLSYKEKLKKMILKKSDFTFETIKNNQFNQIIKNQYMEIVIHKKLNFQEPISFVLNGTDTRHIFETFVHDKLNVSQLQKDTSLIKISFEDTIPKRATSYINALTKSFIKYSIESKNQQNSRTLNFIITELNNIKNELKKSEKKLETLQVSKNIAKPSEEATLYIKKLSDIEIEISENKLKKKLIINLINFVKNNYNLDAIAPSISKLGDESTLNLITKLQNAQLEEQTLTQEYTDEYPKLKVLRKQIASFHNKIIYNLGSLRKNIEYENSNLLKRKLTYEADMKSLPSKERELVNIKRNYEVKSKMYEYLLKKQAENKILQLATFSNYQIIDSAYSSNIPIKPKRILIILLGTIFGLVLSTLLAFLRNSKYSYIKSKHDIEEQTLLPIYGTIPYQKQKKNSIEVNKVAKSPFTEAFRTLRTNLQLTSKGQKKGTLILITSTIASEGKSTISSNLSTILEMAQYKTLLINLDLRKPSIHKFFDLPNDRGISTFLNGKCTLEEIIYKTEFANLDIIPSGPIASNPSELVLSKQLPIIFEKLKEQYEYIIVDTAPIGIVSDTKTLMQYSDLNLIIIREDYAKKAFLKTLELIIDKHEFQNVGLILNASKEKSGEYGYGYSYEYQ